MAKEPGNTCVLCGYHPVEIVDILKEGKASSRTARDGEVRAARPIAGEEGAVCYLCAPDFDGLLKTAIQTSANYQYARRVISECAAIARLQPGQLIDVRLRGLMQQLEEQALVIQSHERWRKTDREAIRGLMAMVDRIPEVQVPPPPETTGPPDVGDSDTIKGRLHQDATVSHTTTSDSLLALRAVVREICNRATSEVETAIGNYSVRTEVTFRGTAVGTLAPLSGDRFRMAKSLLLTTLMESLK